MNKDYISLSHKKNEIMPLAAMWVDLEMIKLRERQILYITYMWNLKKNLYKWTYLQNRLTDIENKLMVTKGEMEGRDKLEACYEHIPTIILI